MNRTLHLFLLAAPAVLCTLIAPAQQGPIVLNRSGSTIAIEPYAPNIVRVTLSMQAAEATKSPGYGFIATPSATGWTKATDTTGDTVASSRLIVKIADNKNPPRPAVTELDIAKFFNGSTPGADITFN